MAHKTDYKNAVFDKRKWVITENEDGTYTIEDATAYEQEGDVIGADYFNEMGAAMNEAENGIAAAVPKSFVIKSADDLDALTEAGFLPDALLVRQLNKNMGNCTFSIESDGAYVSYTLGGETVKKKLGNANFSFSVKVKGVAKSKANNSERYSVSGTATGSCTDGIVDFSQQFFQSSGYEWNSSADGKESIGVYVQGVTITFDD